MLKRLRRAQGMTEYIIAVGLIAIFVLIAVKLFRNSVDVAIRGGDTGGGMVGGVGNVRGDIDTVGGIGGTGGGGGDVPVTPPDDDETN